MSATRKTHPSIKTAVSRLSALERNGLEALCVGVGKDQFGQMFYDEIKAVSTREARAREERHRKNLLPAKTTLPEIMKKLDEDDRQNLLNLLREAESAEQILAALKGAMKLAFENEKHGR